MKLDDFQALTFDCYGTLIDWDSGIAAALRPAFEAAGVPFDEAEVLAAFADNEWRQQAATPGATYPEVLAAVYLNLALRFNLPTDATAASAFGASVGDWPAFPDTPAALQALKRHYKLVILSNVDRKSFTQSNEKLGVAFDAIVTAQDVGSYKPDPRNFAYAINVLSEMGVPKEAILHCGQSLYHDVAPGRAAGLATLWVNRSKDKPAEGAARSPEGDVRPDFEVASMAELAAVAEAAFKESV